MIDELAERLGVSNTVVVLIAVLVTIQVVVQIGSLIHLARRPAGSITPNRWLWAIVILLGNGLGAVMYLVVARKPPATVVDPLHAGNDHENDVRTRAQRAADTLYGAQRRDS